MNHAFPVAIAMLTPLAISQTFDSADVRVSKAGADQGVFISGGRVEIHGATMLDIITSVYEVEGELVAGGPSWLDVDRFDIVAAAKPSTSEPTLRVMLQALLADRFKLAIHREDRPMPVYALSSGKRVRMKESAAPGPALCRGRREGDVITQECQNITMGDFAFRIRGMGFGYLDHAVVDQTGLKGAYDFTLKWTARGQLHKAGDGDPAVDITLFDAVEKQLGLKLEVQKQSRSVLVVDRVDQKPSGSGDAPRSKPSYPTEFEVAAVRPMKPGAPPKEDRVLPSGQLELSGTLKDLITGAYNLEDYMVFGAPKWIDSDRFEVVAKTQPGVPFDGMRAMLQHLLAERFKLEVHREDQPVEVYALTVGKVAPKLKESSGDARSGCKKSMGDGVLTLTCQNTTMAQLAEKMRDAAPGYIKRPVVDLTGLKGAYDFVFSWAPSGRFVTAAKPGEPVSATASTPTGDLTFFEGLEKYLGLKLAAQKYPMPVVVIDHIERAPADN
jgi:uncharacterized protein (TIGR03435 family)